MVKDIDREDRDTLEAELKIIRDEPKTNQVKNKGDDSIEKRPDIESKQTRVDSIINQYQDIIVLSDEIASIIKDRSKQVKVIFNPNIQITLRDSIRRVFGIDTDIVTYDMYKHCLELKEELEEKDRETMRAT